MQDTSKEKIQKKGNLYNHGKKKKEKGRNKMCERKFI